MPRQRSVRLVEESVELNEDTSARGSDETSARKVLAVGADLTHAGRKQLSITKRATMKMAERADEATQRCPAPLRCVACCCCWTFTGLRSLLTNENTVEFALAFIIGEAFGAWLESIVSNLVAPLVTAMPPFSLSGWRIAFGHGYVLLVMGDQTNDMNEDNLYSSATTAVDAGAKVFAWLALWTDTLTFLITMIAVYWTFNLLEKFQKREAERRESELRERMSAVARESGMSGVMMEELVAEELAGGGGRRSSTWTSRRARVRPGGAAIAADDVRTLQLLLQRWGLFDGVIDGSLSERLLGAVRRISCRDGDDDAADASRSGSRTLQLLLSRWGYWEAPVDGRFTEELSAALCRFCASGGRMAAAVDGVADGAAGRYWTTISRASLGPARSSEASGGGGEGGEGGEGGHGRGEWQSEAAAGDGVLLRMPPPPPRPTAPELPPPTAPPTAPPTVPPIEPSSSRPPAVVLLSSAAGGASGRLAHVASSRPLSSISLELAELCEATEALFPIEVVSTEKAEQTRQGAPGTDDGFVVNTVRLSKQVFRDLARVAM